MLQYKFYLQALEIKATNATVAKAAAMSSNITAIANNNSDFPDQASKENNRFVEAINIPDTNIALITPESQIIHQVT